MASHRGAQDLLDQIFCSLGSRITALPTAVPVSLARRCRRVYILRLARWTLGSPGSSLLSYKGDLLQENLSQRTNVFERGMSSEISIPTACDFQSTMPHGSFQGEQKLYFIGILYEAKVPL